MNKIINTQGRKSLKTIRIGLILLVGTYYQIKKYFIYVINFSFNWNFINVFLNYFIS